MVILSPMIVQSMISRILTAIEDHRLDLYIIHDGSTYKGKTIHTDITTANNNDGLNKISNSTRTGYYMKKLLREDCNPDPNAKNAQYHYPVYSLYSDIP